MDHLINDTFMEDSSVLNLPDEIIMHVASFLKAKDLRTCTTTCDKLYAICSEYCLWRRLFVDIDTNSCPSGRLCHTATVDNNKMYVYGGHITQPSSEYFHSVKQDLFEFDFATRNWTEYSPENAPRRTEHTSVCWNGLMLVFGGYSGAGYENSVMSFDTRTKTWSQMATTGETPSARSAHSAVCMADTMFIFGGWNGVQCMNDLYALDLRTRVWRLVTPQSAASPRTDAQTIICTGEIPISRCSHGAVSITPQTGGHANCMYVFGGYAIDGAAESPNKGYLDDLFEFNFDTLAWRRIKTKGTPPTPRSRFRLISHGNNIYMFAGWNSAKHFSSLHKFDCTTNQWTEIPTDFRTDGIGQFSMVENAGIMYVFSGFSPSVGCRSNLFAYPLAPIPVQQSP